MLKTIVLSIVGVFSIFAFAIFVSTCAPTGTNRVINLDQSTPEKTFQFYWKASLERDIESIRSIAGSPPIDLLENCRGSKTESVGSNEISLLTIPLKGGEHENLRAETAAITILGVDQSISSLSRLIQVNKINYERVLIIENRIFENEGIIEFDTSDLKGNPIDSNRKVAFFIKQSDKWVIVASVNKGALPFLYKNIYFATSRPNCSEN